MPNLVLQVAAHIEQAAQVLEEARAAGQAGLASERQLSAEVDRLRAQLGGEAPAEDLLAPLQRQVGDACA